MRRMCDAQRQVEAPIMSQGCSRPKDYADHFFPLTHKLSKHLGLLRKLDDKSKHISHLVVPLTSLVHTEFPSMKTKLHLLSVTSLLEGVRVGCWK